MPTVYVGAADLALTATASSGLPVSYASSAPAVATIVGGKLHIVGAGTATITATQGGNENWNAAPAISKLLTVRTQQQDIRDFYAVMKSRIEAHDQAGFFALFAPDYIHQGLTIADRFDHDLATAKTFSFNITNIAITGTDAKVTGSATLAFKWGEPVVTWSEPDTSDKSPGIGWLRKTAAGWQVVGDQKACPCERAYRASHDCRG